MKIRDFFENYRHCYEIHVTIYEKNNRLKGGWVIYTDEEYDNFINDYGDEEFEKWSVEHGVECTQFYFFFISF
jgi:hypothetical protein